MRGKSHHFSHLSGENKDVMLVCRYQDVDDFTAKICRLFGQLNHLDVEYEAVRKYGIAYDLSLQLLQS
jgi:hypothetical protein